MVKIIKLEKANDKKHKWIATFDDGKKTKFGAYGMDDFTLTKNEEQKNRYLARHKKDLKTNNPQRAGYLSYYVLWNLPTIEASVRDFNKRFG
jgi:hypothetical protein